MIPMLIASRHDSRWHPNQSRIVDAFSSPSVYWQRQRSAVPRSSQDWRPGLGELSTAELVARRLGIPGPYLRPRRRSLGQQGPPTPAEQQVQQISTIASAGASATTGILVGLGVVSGPIGAAVAGIVTVAQLLVGVFRGCGETCIEATDIVNQVEPILQQNVENYVNSPVRTQSMQQAALNNFQTAWQAVVANCSNPQLGQAGQNCISERQQGSCAYKTSPGGWSQQNGTWVYTFPGANGSGSSCWNWWIGYENPIATDPNVQPDSAVTQTSATSIPTGTAATVPTPAADFTPLLVIGGLLLGAWLLL